MIDARVRGVLLAALAPLFFAAPGLSQALTGTITGRALDAGGGVLPGVEIAVSSPAMIGGPRTVFSDTQGVYRATQLPPGEYRVTFKLPGFSMLNIDGVRLDVGATMTINGRTHANSNIYVGSSSTLTFTRETFGARILSRLRRCQVWTD